MNQSKADGDLNEAYRGRPWRWLRGQLRLLPQMAFEFEALRARLVQFSDEAAERVVRDELLAVQLEPRRGRGVVGFEPLLDGAALVRMAI